MDYETENCSLSSPPAFLKSCSNGISNKKNGVEAPSYVAGIDLGGSHVTCKVFSSSGEEIQSHSLPVKSREVEAVIGTIVECCQLCQVNGSTCRGLGIAVPGNVNPDLGTTRYLPNFGWLSEVHIGKLLSEKLSIHNIHLRNDGRCAALAEHKYGVGIGSKVFAMLTLGTGIGGALVINGALFDGFSYDAGDFGHHVICSGREDAMDCVCGKRGCFEVQASAEGLVKHFHRRGGEAKNALEVFQRLREGDEKAIQAFAIFKDNLATGLANLVTFYNPEIIAIGGGISKAPELFEGLQEAVDSKTLPASRGIVKIFAASLHNEAGAIGAALLV